MGYEKSEFHRLLSSVDSSVLVKILEKSKMKYAYSKDTKIYSVRFYVKKGKGIKEERILTMRVSPKFLEYSIADGKGNVLEVIKQERSKLRFNDFKKKKA